MSFSRLIIGLFVVAKIVFKHLNNLPVGRQPLHAVQFVGGEPAGSLMFEEGQRAALDGA